MGWTEADCPGNPLGAHSRHVSHACGDGLKISFDMARFLVNMGGWWVLLRARRYRLPVDHEYKTNNQNKNLRIV